jgi:hypothetical protein
VVPEITWPSSIPKHKLETLLQAVMDGKAKLVIQYGNDEPKSGVNI